MSVELEGGLTEDRYVVDFVVLKRIVREVCDSLDHHFLLPQHSTHLDISKAGREWVIHFEDRRYVLPDQDVLSLPVDNITAERLAQYICGQVIAELVEQEVQKFIQDGFDWATKIIQERETEFERLAQGLLEYETLTGEEIKRVIAGLPPQADEDEGGSGGSGEASVTAIPKTKKKPKGDGGMEPEPMA